MNNKEDWGDQKIYLMRSTQGAWGSLKELDITEEREDRKTKALGQDLQS